MTDETPVDYAQRRANETGMAYIVTNLGHAWADYPENRQTLKELDLKVAYRLTPTTWESTQ